MLTLVSKLAGALFALVITAAAAWAHASLVETNPADGARLAALPAVVQLEFDERVEALRITLMAPDGKDSELTARTQDRRVMVALPSSSTAAGTYALGWRVVSADGHPVSGTMIFTVGTAGPAAVRPLSEEGSPGLSLAIWLARFFCLAGLVGGVGGGVFLKLVAGTTASRPEIRMVAAICAIGLTAVLLSAGLHGLALKGEGPEALLHASVWTESLSSGYGHGLVAAFTSLCVTLAALAVAAPAAASVLSCIALVLAGLVPALSGHALTVSPAWLGQGAIALHVMAAILWGGALLPLVLRLITSRTGAAIAARRLSALLLPTVVLLALSGTLLAGLEGITLQNLLAHAFGRILAIKLVLVLALLACGAMNRWCLVPRLQGHEGAQPEAQFRRVLLAEAVLVVIILGLVAGWRFAPPPAGHASAAVSRGRPATLHMHTDAGMAMFDRESDCGARVRLLDRQGKPLEAQTVTLAFTLPDSGTAGALGPIERTATRSQPGIWCVGGFILPRAGEWSVEVRARIGDFDAVSFAGRLAVP